MRSRAGRGFTLVEIMITVGIVVIVSAIAIPNILRAKINANDALAKSTLRAISSAAESYSNTQNGNYPSASSELIGATPPYLNTDYCGQTLSGYLYTCTFSAGSYTVVATPATIGSTGTTTFTITTGGILKP